MSAISAALRLGTRGSALALAQAGQVAAALTARTGRSVELVEVTTAGDRSATAVAALGGTGVFVTALRERLLAGEVDLAVHSLKDLPTAAPDGLALAAVPERADPRDALVARGGRRLLALPAGATVGTGSPRRGAALRALGRDLDVVALRGNVDTRLAAVAAGHLDAVVVAAAGLARLGRLGEASELVDPELVMPAPGQGALAVECRGDDRPLRELLATVDDVDTRAEAAAERALLAALQAGCTAPVGALAEHVAGPDGRRLSLRGAVAAGDGTRILRASTTGPPDRAAQLGRNLAEELVRLGATELMGVSP